MEMQCKERKSSDASTPGTFEVNKNRERNAECPSSGERPHVLYSKIAQANDT